MGDYAGLTAMACAGRKKERNDNRAVTRILDRKGHWIEKDSSLDGTVARGAVDRKEQFLK